MQAILGVTIPFFALVLCGYLAARSGVLPDSAIPGLNAFVLYFALPCMLFRFGASTPILDLLNPAVFGLYLGCGLAVVGFTLAVTLGPAVNLKDAAFGALVAAFPNTGFMGVPLLVSLLGPSAVGPLVCTLLADLFVISSLCIALAQWHDPSGAGPRAAAWRALRGTLTNPMPWSIALGAAASIAGWRLIGPVDVVVRMLADSASPVALFTIGAVLCRAQRHAEARTPWSRVAPVAAIKLLLHPLLVLLAAGVLSQLGLPLTTAQVTVVTLAAALPSASNVSLLTERFGADTGRVARIIMTSTVAAFVSFTLIATLLGVRPH